MRTTRPASAPMLKHIVSNWSLQFLQLGTFMFLASFVYRSVGAARFGIWETLVATGAPIQLLALGLPMATVRGLSRAFAQKDDEAARKLLGTSLSMTLILGLAAGLIGLASYYTFTSLMHSSETWSKLSASWLHDASVALALVLGNVACGFALRLPYAVFDAREDFVVRNLILACGLGARVAATVIGLSITPDLVVLALVQIGVAILEFLLCLVVLGRRHSSLRIRPGRIEWALAKSLLAFSVFAFLMNMGTLLAFRLDALVIAAHRAPTDVAIYGWGNKIFDPLIGVVLGIGAVIMPMATRASTQGSLDEVRTAFLKWSKIAVVLVMCIGGYILAVGPQFLEAWVGDEYYAESGVLLQVLMLSFLLFLPVRGVALPVLMGLGRVRAPGLGFLGMGLVNVCLSLALIGPLGLLGVALGTAIPNLVFAFAFAHQACRALDLRVRDWILYAFGRATVACAVAALALEFVSRHVEIAGYARVILAGLVYCSVFGVLTLFFVFRRDPHVDVRGLTSRMGFLGSSQ